MMQPQRAAAEWAPGAALARIALLGALVLTLLLYLPGLGGPLLLDDLPQLGHLLNPGDRQAGGPSALLGEGGWLKRPVAMASFLLSAQLGPDTWHWKLLNVLLHGLCGLLVFALSRRLFLLAGGVQASRASGAALWVAALWLLHPLHVSTVLYLVQRMSILAALFVLAGLWLYVVGRQRQLAGRGGTAPLLAALLLCWPLATLSKENGILLPALAALVELTLLRGRGLEAVQPRLRWLVAALALGLPAALSLLWIGLGGLSGYAARPFSLAERLLTQPRALLDYLKMLLVPVQRHMGFVHDDYVVSRGLLDPPATLVALAALTALVALTLWLRRRAPLVSLGLGFFLVGHVLEAGPIPLEMVFEHRNYLPSVGLFLALAAGFAAVLPRRPLRLGAAGAALLLAGFVTQQRVQAWSSGPLLMNDMLSAHPGSERVRSLLARQLSAAGRNAQALEVLQPLPGSGAALHRLHIRCLSEGALSAGALDRVRAALQPPLETYAVMGLEDLSGLGLDDACAFDRAAFLRLLEQARTLPTPGRANRYSLAMHAAHYRWLLGRPEQALAALDEAAATDPRNPLPHMLAAQWLAELDRLPEARAALARGQAPAEKLGGAFARRYHTLVEQLAAPRPPGPAPAP